MKKPERITITSFWLDWLLLPIMLGAGWLTLRWAQDSTLVGVLEEAERVSRLLPDDPDAAEFVDLARRASTIADNE